MPIVLASDEYQNNCVIHLRSKFSIIELDEASRFNSRFCQGALFDQEVLGASTFFIGDKLSTFSQAIHQIRTLRNLYDVETTKWV
jgi:hypothetical protein